MIRTYSRSSCDRTCPKSLRNFDIFWRKGPRNIRHRPTVINLRHHQTGGKEWRQRSSITSKRPRNHRRETDGGGPAYLSGRSLIIIADLKKCCIRIRPCMVTFHAKQTRNRNAYGNKKSRLDCRYKSLMAGVRYRGQIFRFPVDYWLSIQVLPLPFGV